MKNTVTKTKSTTGLAADETQFKRTNELKYKSEKKFRTSENSLRNKTQQLKSNTHISGASGGGEKVQDGSRLCKLLAKSKLALAQLY